jgi:HEAT repeat protein/MFS family permease
MEIHRGLNKVVVAWMFGSMWMEIAHGAPLVGLFNTLGASTFLIGLVGAMPAVATLVQPLGSYALERTSRRKDTFVVLGSVHRLLWILLAFTPLILGKPELSIPIALSVLAISFLMGAFVGPFWLTWIGDLVPEKLRATFLGRRSMLGRVAGALAALLVGQYLAQNPPLSKLAIAFSVAGIVGFSDIILHKWVPDVPVRRRAAAPGSILRILLEPTRDRSFRSFLLFAVLMSLGVAVLGAYLSLYLLRELSLSYFQIALYMTVLNALAYIVFSELFGICVAQFGNKPVLILTSMMVAFVPAMLILCRPRSHFMLALVGILGGASWAGINLAMLNMQIGLAPAELRHRYTAAFAFLTGAATAVGALLGAGIATATQDLSVTLFGLTIHGLHFVFLASALLRAASVPFLRSVQEPDVKPVGYVVRALRTLNPLRTLFNIYTCQLSSDESRRAHAIHNMGRSGTTLGLHEVVSALDDSSRSVREEAARALGEMRASEAVEPLVDKLQDEGSLIQAVSASSLGKIGDRTAVPPLVQTLGSSDREVRGAAAVALGEIGDRSAVQPLIDLMKRETDSFVFASGAEALGRLGEAQAILITLPALERVAHPIVRKQLAVVVGNLVGEEGEFYSVLSAEERIEGLGASRLISDIRQRLSRRKRGEARVRALEALRAITAALAEAHVDAVLDATDRLVSEIIGLRFPTEVPWQRNIRGIWQRDEKVGCQLVFLDYVLKQREQAPAEEVLLALYALRCLCKRLLRHRGREIAEL